MLQKLHIDRILSHAFINDLLCFSKTKNLQFFPDDNAINPGKTNPHKPIKSLEKESISMIE